MRAWKARRDVNFFEQALDASQYWVSKSLFEANFADCNNTAVIFR